MIFDQSFAVVLDRVRELSRAAFSTLYSTFRELPVTSRVEIMRAKFYCEFATSPHPSNINDSCFKHLLVAWQPQILILDRSTCDQMVAQF
jgi:hypothetical protein